jgi:hypothetical protein
MLDGRSYETLKKRDRQGGQKMLIATAGCRTGETFQKSDRREPETAYSNNRRVTECVWRRLIMLDGRAGETFGKKGSSVKSETAYSNNRRVTKCGWHFQDGRAGETFRKNGSPGS